jgi:hypothetical protein
MFQGISVKFSLTIVTFIRAMVALATQYRGKAEVGITAGVIEWLSVKMGVGVTHPERVGLVGELVSKIVDNALNPEGIEAMIAGLPEGAHTPLNIRIEWVDGMLECIFKARYEGCPTFMSGFEMEMEEEDLIEVLGKAAKVVGPLPAIFRNGAAEIFITSALKKIGASGIDVTVK